MDWIAMNIPEDAIFLTGPESGLMLPARTGRKVIYGHPYETVHAEEKLRAVSQFLVNPSRLNTDEFLATADYIYISGREKQALASPLPPTIPIVFSNEEVTIYQVAR